MLNRNSSQSSLSRHSSLHKQHQSSFSIEKNKNYGYFQKEQNQNFMKNFSSPINKVEMEYSRFALQEDCGNFTSNYVSQEQGMPKYPSRGQSPANKQNKQPQFFSSHKFSIAQNPILNNISCKSQWPFNPPKQISHQFSTLQRKHKQQKVSFRKNPSSQQQQTSYSQKMSENNQPQQFYSQQSIQSNINNNNINKNIQQKYSNLSHSYQQLQHEYERIKQQNEKLRVSKQELMSQNMRVRKQATLQVGKLSQQIQSLKQQIYRMQMDRCCIQSQHISSNKSLSISSITNSNNNRGCYTRDLSFYRARSSNPMGNVNQNGEVNLFYLQQLQRQNDQLVRENRRLNDMIMKKLKHSVVE